MIEKNLSRLHARTAPGFLVLILAISFLHAIVLHFLPDNGSSYPIERVGSAKYFVAGIFAPLVETLLFQYIPARVIARFRLAGPSRITVMVVPFALAHVQLNNLVATGLNGFYAGYVLGICYLICSARSMRYAFAATALVHALHNLLILPFV